jgi:hypothetical protein
MANTQMVSSPKNFPNFDAGRPHFSAMAVEKEEIEVQPW